MGDRCVGGLVGDQAGMGHIEGIEDLLLVGLSVLTVGIAVTPGGNVGDLVGIVGT